jgi:P-type Mg2+ transporter
MYRTHTQQATVEIGTTISTSPAEDLLSCPLPDLYTRLHTSAEGLSEEDARRRLKTGGANETASMPHVTGITQFLHLFLSPLVIILLLASVITAILGDAVSASIIVVIVLLGIILDFVQTIRARLARAEEPDHPGVKTPSSRRGVSGGWH